MNSYVLIKEGSTGTQSIKDKVPSIKNVQDSKTGMFVTVDGTEGFDNPKNPVKIKFQQMLHLLIGVSMLSS